MEKLSMCRICLSGDTRLQSIFETHLQEMYESLTMKLLVTEDSRPSLACDLCCSRLETCYELRRQSLRSEEMFTQLLRHKAQVKLRVMPNMHVSMKTTADVYDVVKQEDAEDDAAVEQDDADPYHSALGLHTECDIPLDVVKEETSDDDTGAPRLAAQTDRNYTLLNSLKRTDQTMDKVEKRKRETIRAVEDTPVEKYVIEETGDHIDIRLHHGKQNNDTFDHSDTHKEMSENKISADQRDNCSSSNKLTPLSCDTCQKCFTCKSKLIRHIRTHTFQKSYVCNVCKKCFTRKYYLDSHIRTHTGEKPFECNVCKKCFSLKCHLHKHMRTHTVREPYRCNVCNKCFSRKYNLGIHKRIHTDDKPYECNICNKRFSRRDNLLTHIRSHTGETLYKCNLCKKCFNKNTDLSNHIRTHTGEKPYECNVCKKRFSQRSNLQIHISTQHTGQTPYACNVCKKSFSHRGNLIAHTRTHTGEKPYECNICKKWFTKKYNLDAHMRTHTQARNHMSHD